MTRIDALDTLSGQQAALQAGKCSPRDLVERAIARARECRDLNGFITECFESAQRAADGCAAAAGEAGSLRGIPFAHKDVFCTRGVRTTCASRMLQDFVPPYDATVAERLNQAQAILLGKANMDEFAMGSSNENSHFGPVRNPWDPTRVPGGSSGGSAALVAAGIVPFATGSDTGGSVRQPAAFCGITGLKPTYGRVSRHGLVAYASSLDQAGILAHTAQDCATVLQVLAGHDPRDATSCTHVAQDYSAHLQAGVTGLRIGVVRGYFGAGVDSAVADAVHQALARLEAAGAKLVDIDLPTLPHAIPAYYVLAPAEASSNLARYDGVRYGHRAAGAADLNELYGRSRAEGFGTEVKRRILIGTYVLSAGYYDAYYRHAQKVRRLIADDFARAFTQVDLLAGPTAPSVAFKLGEKCNDPVSMYAADTNTVAVNLAGLPAISLPAGFVDSLPVGLQLVAPAFAESDLLRAGHALQQATDWHRARPGAPAAGIAA